MLNNYDESKEEREAHIVFLARRFESAPPSPLSVSWWVVGVRRIMSFARQSRVKMNGCPFGSKMAIIIPTWCRQIKPPKPFLIHTGFCLVSFFFCFFVLLVNAALFYSSSCCRVKPCFSTS